MWCRANTCVKGGRANSRPCVRIRKVVTPPVKACAPRLAAGVSVIAAFKVIAATLLGQMQANRQAAIKGRDPEYLHQMRVAVRRLRSLCGDYVKVLPEPAVRPRIVDLKWLAHALGPARDADVFVIDIWPPLRAALGENPLLGQLDTQWLEQRRANAVKARRALVSRRYQRFVRRFQRQLVQDTWLTGASPEQLAVLDGAASDFARRVIRRRTAKVRSRGRELLRLDAAQLHALRIRIKKLRYATDDYSSLFEGASLRRLLKYLSRLQDVLGAANDANVAYQLVTEALAGMRGHAATRLRAAVTRWRKARAVTLHRELLVAWRAYRRADKFLDQASDGCGGDTSH